MIGEEKDVGSSTFLKCQGLSNLKPMINETFEEL
jgi:hypothetical protein